MISAATSGPGAGSPADQPAPAPQPAGALWRRTFVRAALVPLTVLAPLVALAPNADQRFNIYWYGAMFAGDPLRIVPHTLRSLPGYLRIGNFRPLGRILEKSLDLLTFRLTEVLGLPANVALRLVSFAAAVVLTAAATVLVESVLARGRLFRDAPSALTALTPFAVGVGFIAAGSVSTTVLFTGLYLLSTGVVLAVAAVACRAVTPDATRLGPWLAGASVLSGVALACFNEITYMALPLATAAALVRGRWVLRIGWRQFATGRGVRLLATLWLGFLPVFVAIRVIIAGYCNRNTCYRDSDVTLGVDAVRTFPIRLISWWPPLMWDVAAGHRQSWVAGTVFAAALLVLAVLAVRTYRDLPRLTRAGTRAALGVATVGALLVALGAGMSSLNADIQDTAARGAWGWGWRDTALTATGGALVVLGAGHALLVSRWRRRWGALLLLAVLALGGAASAAANKAYRDARAVQAPDQLADRVAVEMAAFDRTPAGNARRCALQHDFIALYPTLAFSRQRFDQALDAASERIARRPFCSEGATP